MELLSVSEAGKMLGISKHTMRAWVYQRKLPFVRLGRRVLFRVEDLETLIKENLVEARKDD